MSTLARLWIGAVLALPLSAFAALELEGRLGTTIAISAELTLSTCNLTLTDRGGTPIHTVVFEQIESGLGPAPIDTVDFALTPDTHSGPHCFLRDPDVTVIADFDAAGDGNIRNQGSAGNIAVRLWAHTAGGPALFSATTATHALQLQDSGRLWLSAELTPINSAQPVTAGMVDALASFDVVYK